MDRISLFVCIFLTAGNCLQNFKDSTKGTSLLFSKKDFTCGSQFCRNIICRPLTQCPKESIIRNGSLCGCCDKCISYLSENEQCENFVLQNSGGIQHKCKIGLECKNGRCTKRESVSTCDTAVQWRKFLRDDPSSTNRFSEHLWIPDCDAAGNYKTKQCKMKKCLCFDENGTRLFGQAERNLAENMTCGCSKVMASLQRVDQSQWMIKPQEHCTTTGDYSDLQCIGEICFCCNATTGKVIGRVTKFQFMELLPCYDKAKVGKRYETQCELQLMRTQSLRYQFHRKKIEVIGLEKVRCDIDGTFSAKQCKTDRCVCTDRKGTGLKSYDIETRERGLALAMKCNCARDDYDREAIHAHYRRMACDAGGNFVLLQCFDQNHCYCVDEDGDIISKKLPTMNDPETYCRGLLNLLHNPLDSHTTKHPEDETTEDYYDYE